MIFLKFNDARKLILEAFHESWSDSVDAFTTDATERTELKKRTLMDGQIAQPPLSQIQKPYAVIEIGEANRHWRGINGRLTRYEGEITIALHSPLGKGTADIDALTEPFIEKFGKNSIRGVRFTEMFPIDTGAFGKFYRKILDIPFHFYNCESRR